MRTTSRALLTALLFGATAPTMAFAHAFLDHATPAVGGTVEGGPSELQLSFSQNVEVAFSSVKLAGPGGASIPVAKPTIEGSPNTLHVHLPHPLKPGAYTVSWRVVSVDTHPTSGTYRFTVAP